MIRLRIPSAPRLLTATLISVALALPATAQHLSGGRGSFGGHTGGGIGVSHGSFSPQIGPGNFSPRVGFGSGFSAPRNFSAPPRYNWNRVTSVSPSFGRIAPRPILSPRSTFSPMHSRIISGNRMPYTPQHRTGPWQDSRRGDHRRDYDHDRRWRYNGWSQPYFPGFWSNSVYLVGGSLPLSTYPGYWDDIDWGDDYNTNPAAYNNYAVSPYANNGYSGQTGYAPVEPLPNSQPENTYAEAAPAPSPAREPYRPERSEPEQVADRPATTLIFKDGRAPLQVHNYAITRTNLYVYDGQQRNIPLDQLDITATQKANQETGTDFTLPAMP